MLEFDTFVVTLIALVVELIKFYDQRKQKITALALASWQLFSPKI
ncbi:hypothetical protein E0701_02295 [Lactobacillus helveticus]|nr:hypothetical protein [Lactobacillus helveticus]